MSNKIWRHTSLSLALLALLAVPALGQTVSFSDPTGDDNGPGDYVYPTDAVYTRGSFDLTKLEVTAKGDRVTFDVSVAAKLEDPWRMGTGFAVQMVFIFIDTGNDDPHFTSSLPGLNIQFAEPGWDRVVILSPQGFSRVNQEVQAKVAADKQSAVVVPTRVRGRGQTINGSVKLDELGGGDPSTWGYQVVMQSNEGFPAEGDLLTRKVNEFEGQHRFGGGTDYDCDPHVMDILAGNGEGAEDEVAKQHEMLSYECAPDHSAAKMATLSMVRKGGS